MATYVKGDAVENAETYALYEKNSDSTYTELASASEINFELDGLGLAAGDHTLVVKAKDTDGVYADSDYSNEVTYTVADTGETDISSLFTSAFSTGAIIADTENSSYGGSASNQTAYIGNTDNSAYISVSEYAGKTLQITLPLAIGTAHVQYGLVFYTGQGKSYAISSVTMTYTDGSVAAETKEVTIPTDAKYARTTWHTADNEAACGVPFSAKIIA